MKIETTEQPSLLSAKQEMNEKIYDAVKDYNERKNKAIMKRINKLGLTDPYSEEESSRRFKNYISETPNKNEERIYFNDGSKDGLFVIGFKNVRVAKNRLTGKQRITFSTFTKTPKD